MINDEISDVALKEINEEKLMDIAEVKRLVLQSQKQARKINDIYENVVKESGEIHNLVNTAVTHVDSINEKQKKIDEFNKVIDKIKIETVTKHEEIKLQLDMLQDKIKSIEECYSSILKFTDSLFEDEGESDSPIYCMKSKIDTFYAEAELRISDLKEKKENINVEFASLKQILEARINSLLPGAGASGLAGAYFDAKSRYGSVPYKPPEGNRSRWLLLLYIIIHLFKNNISTIFYYVLFITPLMYIARFFISIYFGNFEHPLPPITYTDYVYRIIITAPLAIISWFGYSSIRQNRRLYNQIDHKQRVMELYYSFKKEIDLEGTKEQKQERR